MKYTSAAVIALLMNISFEEANASVIQQKMQNLLEQQDTLQDALQDEAIEDVDNVMAESPATPPPKGDAAVDPPAKVNKVENPDDVSVDAPAAEKKEDAPPALNSSDPAKGLKEEEKKEEKKVVKKEEAAEAKPVKAANATAEAAKKAEPKEEKEVKKLEKEVPDLDKKKYPGCPSS